jgi:hypothetical protein
MDICSSQSFACQADLSTPIAIHNTTINLSLFLTIHDEFKEFGKMNISKRTVTVAVKSLYGQSHNQGFLIGHTTFFDRELKEEKKKLIAQMSR